MFKLKNTLMDENFGCFEGYTSSSGSNTEVKKSQDSKKKEDSKSSDSPSYDNTAMTNSFFSTLL